MVMVGVGGALTLLIATWLLAALRWRGLINTPGSFPCSLVDPNDDKRPTRPGIARFGSGDLHWFARNSLSPRPVHKWPRRGLRVDGCPDSASQTPSHWETIKLSSLGRSYQMVLSRSASAGLVGWIEAGPSRSPEPQPR